MQQLIENIRNNERMMQFIRFCIIGTLSAAVHYGIYFLLQYWINLNIAYTAGYIISFVGNYFLTNYFTFRTRPSWGKFIGFAGSHGLNYVLHIVLFNIFLWAGVHKLIAPPLVMLVAMLVQFSVLRIIFTWNKNKS